VILKQKEKPIKGEYYRGEEQKEKRDIQKSASKYLTPHEREGKI